MSESRRAPAWRIPSPPVVRRAVWIAVGWAYVAALAALVLVGLAVLVAVVVTLAISVFDASNRGFQMADVWPPVRVVAWVVFPLAGMR